MLLRVVSDCLRASCFWLQHPEEMESILFSPPCDATSWHRRPRWQLRWAQGARRRNWSTPCSDTGFCRTWDLHRGRCNSSCDSNSFCSCSPCARPLPNFVSGSPWLAQLHLSHHWDSLCTDTRLACKASPTWGTHSKVDDIGHLCSCIFECLTYFPKHRFVDFQALSEQWFSDLWKHFHRFGLQPCQYRSLQETRALLWFGR